MNFSELAHAKFPPRGAMEKGGRKKPRPVENSRSRSKTAEACFGFFRPPFRIPEEVVEKAEASLTGHIRIAKNPVNFGHVGKCHKWRTECRFWLCSDVQADFLQISVHFGHDGNIALSGNGEHAELLYPPVSFGHVVLRSF